MQIRPLILSDIKAIDEFWQKHHRGKHGIPKRRFVLTDDVVADDNDHPIAYGIVRMFAEALLYIDKDKSKYAQAKAFKLLMEKALVDCKNADLDELNVGIADPSFAGILKDRYQMKKRDQEMLSLEI
jgi:hypothetical protein